MSDEHATTSSQFDDSFMANPPKEASTDPAAAAAAAHEAPPPPSQQDAKQPPPSRLFDDISSDDNDSSTSSSGGSPAAVDQLESTQRMPAEEGEKEGSVPVRVARTAATATDDVESSAVDDPAPPPAHPALPEDKDIEAHELNQDQEEKEQEEHGGDQNQNPAAASPTTHADNKNSINKQPTETTAEGNNLDRDDLHRRHIAAKHKERERHEALLELSNIEDASLAALADEISKVWYETYKKLAQDKEKERTRPRLFAHLMSFADKLSDTCGPKHVFSTFDTYHGEWAHGTFHGHGRFYFAKTGAVYDGEFIKGKRWTSQLTKREPRHSSIAVYHNDRSNFKHQGMWVNDKREGFGELVEGQGTYQGEFLDNCFHGSGTYEFRNGAKYVGDFKRNEFDGEGTYVFSSGDEYTGAFEQGMQSGYGVYHSKISGHTYAGWWLEDAKHGRGKYAAPEFSYDGEWVNGAMHGHGTYQYASGDKYEGEWRDNREHGSGKYTFAAVGGGSYDGEWLQGQRHGRGVTAAPNGESYDGDWIANEKDGNGTFKYPSGASYSGQWSDDQMHGQGVYRFASGKMMHVHCDKGAFVTKRPIASEQRAEDILTYLSFSTTRKHVATRLTDLPKWLDACLENPDPRIAQRQEAHKQRVEALKVSISGRSLADEVASVGRSFTHDEKMEFSLLQGRLERERRAFEQAWYDTTIGEIVEAEVAEFETLLGDFESSSVATFRQQRRSKEEAILITEESGGGEEEEGTTSAVEAGDIVPTEHQTASQQELSEQDDGGVAVPDRAAASASATTTAGLDDDNVADVGEEKEEPEDHSKSPHRKFTTKLVPSPPPPPPAATTATQSDGSLSSSHRSGMFDKGTAYDNFDNSLFDPLYWNKQLADITAPEQQLQQQEPTMKQQHTSHQPPHRPLSARQVSQILRRKLNHEEEGDEQMNKKQQLTPQRPPSARQVLWRSRKMSSPQTPPTSDTGAGIGADGQNGRSTCIFTNVLLRNADVSGITPVNSNRRFVVGTDAEAHIATDLLTSNKRVAEQKKLQEQERLQREREHREKMERYCGPAGHAVAMTTASSSTSPSHIASTYSTQLPNRDQQNHARHPPRRGYSSKLSEDDVFAPYFPSFSSSSCRSKSRDKTNQGGEGEPLTAGEDDETSESLRRVQEKRRQQQQQQYRRLSSGGGGGGLSGAGATRRTDLLPGISSASRLFGRGGGVAEELLPDTDSDTSSALPRPRAYHEQLKQC